MMASTHALIGAVSFAGISALCGQPAALPLSGATIAAATLAALLPDVDTPSSRAGTCVFPLARWLEKRFGHRTITHSALGWLLFALLASPMLFFPLTQTLFPAALWGYFSHILADAATKSGVPLAWPCAARYVFPGHEKNRIKTGSLGEMGVLAGCLVVAALLVPVALHGPRRLLHLATGSVEGAIRDAENWGDDYQLWAKIEGYDVRKQRVVNGDFAVVGRREDGTLVIEAPDAQTGVTGYKLLKTGGTEIERISPRRVTVSQGFERRDQTLTVAVSNLTLAALARELLKAIPTQSEGYAPAETAPQEQWRNTRFLHEVLVSGAGECYPFPQDAAFAPLDVPQFGLKTVVFSGSKIHFDFAQPRHIGGAGSRVTLKSASLTIRLPQNARLPPLKFPLVRRTLEAKAMRRQGDLLARVGDIVREGQTLNRTFAQSLEPELSDADREHERAAQDAQKERLVLEQEERALRQKAPSSWAMLASSYAARRQSLERAANWTPPTPQTAPRPAPARAPFDAVVEAIEWEPPTVPTQKGERPEHSARLTLVKIYR